MFENSKNSYKHFSLDDSDKGWIGNKENLAKSSSKPDLHSVKYDDNEKSTDVFDDTIKSLPCITPITGEYSAE